MASGGGRSCYFQRGSGMGVHVAETPDRLTSENQSACASRQIMPLETTADLAALKKRVCEGIQIAQSAL